MKNCKVIFACLIGSLLFGGVANTALADATTSIFQIIRMHTYGNIPTNGFGANMHLQPQSGHTFSNPSYCTSTDFYVLDGALSGHKERVAVALGAFLNGKSLQLTIDSCGPSCGCVDNRPRITNVIAFQ